jgi:hypothetical protein
MERFIDLQVFDLKTGVHKFSKKCRSQLKILGARTVMYTKSHTKDIQILGANLTKYLPDDLAPRI